MKKEKPPDLLVATNAKARRDYFILETFEAGIVLVGCEVKSLRMKNASLDGSFARMEEDAPYLHNLYVAPYEMGNRENPEPRRVRKLLLHRSEIHKLRSKIMEKGFALIPLRIYFNKRGIAKVELGVAKGKKFYDKRADIKKRTTDREIDRAVKNRNRR